MLGRISSLLPKSARKTLINCTSSFLVGVVDDNEPANKTRIVNKWFNKHTKNNSLYEVFFKLHCNINSRYHYACRS